MTKKAVTENTLESGSKWAIKHPKGYPKDYTITGAKIYIKRRYGRTKSTQIIDIEIKPGAYCRVLEVDLGGDKK